MGADGKRASRGYKALSLARRNNRRPMAHNTAGTLLRSASVAVGKKGGGEVEKLRARKVESSIREPPGRILTCSIFHPLQRVKSVVGQVANIKKTNKQNICYFIE